MGRRNDAEHLESFLTWAKDESVTKEEDMEECDAPAASINSFMAWATADLAVKDAKKEAPKEQPKEETKAIAAKEEIREAANEVNELIVPKAMEEQLRAMES